MGDRCEVSDSRMAEALREAKLMMPFPSDGFKRKVWEMDHEAIEFLMAKVAQGYSISEWCEEMGLSEAIRQGIYRWVQNLKEGDDWYEAWENARSCRAAHLAERLLEVNAKVACGDLTPSQGSMLSKNLQWVASRMDPDRWGQTQKQNVNLKVSGARQHLEAVRELANMVREGVPGAVIDAKMVEAEVVEPELITFEELLD